MKFIELRPNEFVSVGFIAHAFYEPAKERTRTVGSKEDFGDKNKVTETVESSLKLVFFNGVDFWIHGQRADELIEQIRHGLL